MLRVGQSAPDFNARAYVLGAITNVALHEFRGMWVVLLFYPLDFTFSCPIELRAFDDHLFAFYDLDAEVIAISVGSVYFDQAWCDSDLADVRYPLLPDTTKQIGRDYGLVERLEDHHSVCGICIIDPAGIVQYQAVKATHAIWSPSEILRLLEVLQMDSQPSMQPNSIEVSIPKGGSAYREV